MYKKKLLIQTIIYSIGFLFPKIMNYAFLKFFTKYLKREEFSLYTDMYALSFLVIGFLSFGLENTYFRFLSKKNNNKEVIFSTIVIIQFFITSFFLILSVNSIKYLISITGYKNHPEYFFMFFLIIFFDTICILPMAWIRANEMSLRYTTINVINILVQSIFIIYMFSFYRSLKMIFFIPKFYSYIFEWINSFTDKIGYIFFANMIASLSNFILIIPIFLRKVSIKKFNKILAKEMLNYGIPIMLGTIAFSINENLDKILIKRWLSDEINGSYSACYKIASFMNLYIRAFRLGIEPFFFKKSEDADAKYYYEEIIYIFIILGLIFYVLICGNITIIIDFLIDKKYHLAISIIPIVMMGNLFLGIYTNLSIFYKIIDKPIIGTYISLIGVFITILFNITFISIPNSSFMIPAWGTITSYGSMVLVLYFWSKKNFFKFYNTKIWNIILHLLFAFLLVLYIINNKNRIEINFFLQFLYIIIVFLFEKNNFFSKLK
ncbi:lipopolysaccharide biosynthesis protein [Blattabacterium sp. (Cryptocercus punctulatus) str. Cpu]|uniref:lipopolysaccharide biosynthesis protein n=1 Tax=Blattabacterium sp. (Cryptocercus punctulatus) str. Cpu TaxID=1075399 RepID=UPI00023871E6|nr:oligosaccharide flippase family protein [Blattabacterium sp. (Cryptocercus punctulatus) str. Cpu]AEU09602.1 putative polysaccharide biosynthesis protein [Blattabacterium sp. (Cryptocercus punctulatus) str. Cpu]